MLAVLEIESHQEPDINESRTIITGVRVAIKDVPWLLRREIADQSPIDDQMVATGADVRLIIPGDRKERIRQGV